MKKFIFNSCSLFYMTLLFSFYFFTLRFTIKKDVTFVKPIHSLMIMGPVGQSSAKR